MTAALNGCPCRSRFFLFDFGRFVLDDRLSFRLNVDNGLFNRFLNNGFGDRFFSGLFRCFRHPGRTAEPSGRLRNILGDLGLGGCRFAFQICGTNLAEFCMIRIVCSALLANHVYTS